jgi:hypothetical protein
MPVAHDSQDPVLNVAIKDREHLIRFLNGSGRQFFVMRSEDVVRALPHFEEGVQVLQNLVSCYRDFRRLVPSGKTDQVKGQEIPRYKGETLEIEELDELIAWATLEKEKLCRAPGDAS